MSDEGIKEQLLGYFWQPRVLAWRAGWQCAAQGRPIVAMRNFPFDDWQQAEFMDGYVCWYEEHGRSDYPQRALRPQDDETLRHWPLD